MTVLHAETRLSNEFRSASRGQQSYVVLDKSLSQIKQASLIVDGEDRYSFIRELNGSPINLSIACLPVGWTLLLPIANT